MRILVGDDTGLIKDIQVEDQKTLATFGRQETGMSVKNMIRVGPDYFVTSHEDHQLRIHCLNDTSYTFETPMKSQSEIMSLSYDGNKIYVLQKDGEFSEVDILYQEDMPYLEEPQTILKINAAQSNRAKLNSFNNSQIAILCNGTNPQIVDLNTKQQIWKAKNVKNDYLDLKVPIHDLDCAFKNENEFYVCTAYKKIRLYDIRVKNCKPIVDYDYSHTKHPLNNILLSRCKNYVYVSDQGGNIVNLDLRKNFQIIGKLKGALGSIKEMVLSESHPYLASVSLDRFLRVYNTNTNQLFKKIYLKQKLSSLVLIDENVEEKEDSDDEEKETIFKPYKHQNEVKKNAKEMRAQAKKARLKLTFEKNKKIKTDNNVENNQEEVNYDEEYDLNDQEPEDLEEY